MNVAGPSRLHLVPGAREGGDYYEEELIRMVAQLDLTATERLQTVHDRGDELSDHEVAFALFVQNARDLAEFNADRALAQRLAADEGEVPEPAPR
jgi:hypothetical protein